MAGGALRALFRGEDGPEAEAGGMLLAEALVRVRAALVKE